MWIYAVLFVIVFCETGLVFTPFLPGDSLLFAAGAVAASSGGSLNVHLIAALLLAAAILGDAVNFAIGKAFGARLFSRPNSRLFKPEYLQKTHAFYEKYGGKTIILARFVPVVRTFAPFVAGMGRMHYATFIRYNIIGALAWVLLLTYLGYAFGNVPLVKQNFGLLVIGNRVVVHRAALARQAKAAPVGRHHAARARKTVAEGIGHELERRAHIHPPVQQHQQRRVRIARRRAPFAQVHADVPQRHVARAQRAQRGVSGCVHGRPFSGMALQRLDGHAKCDPFTI